MLMKFMKLQSSFLKTLASIAGVLMFMLVFIQVTGRYVFHIGFSWTEELARIAMIWTVFLAMPLGFDVGAHIGFEVLTDKVSPKIRRILVIASLIGSIVLLAIISWGAIIFMLRVRQKTPGLGLPFQWIYLAIPFGSLNCIFRLIVCLADNVFNDNKERSIQE